MKISTRDIVLLVLVSSLDGRGGAKVIYALTKQYIREHRKSINYQYRLEMHTFRAVLNRLRRDKLIKNERRGFWKATPKGKNFLHLVEKKRIYEEFRRKKKQEDTIIVFDIPEPHRKKRDYLRIELISLGFKPLQKSVWLGGSPLPIEFINYLKDLRLLRYIHIFTVKKYGTVNK